MSENLKVSKWHINACLIIRFVILVINVLSHTVMFYPNVYLVMRWPVRNCFENPSIKREHDMSVLSLPKYAQAKLSSASNFLKVMLCHLKHKESYGSVYRLKIIDNQHTKREVCSLFLE